MLPPPYRLRRADDIKQVRQNGRRCQHPLIVLYVRAQANDYPASRVAFAVGRFLGKATRRNRLKRRLREAVRQHLDEIRPGFDCLFVARGPSIESSFDDLEAAVTQLLSGSGLVNLDGARTGE